MDSPFEFENADMPIDDDSENGENSHPNVSNADHVTIRKRNGGIRGMAFRFCGTCTGFACSDGTPHDQIDEFNTKFGDRLLATKLVHDALKCISYIVFSYDIARLSSAAETGGIPLIGYIQCTKTIYAKTLQKWMGKDLEWQLVPGGLCGSPEFESEIRESGEERAVYTVHGKLGLNNVGSMEVIFLNFSSLRLLYERQPDLVS